MFKYVLGVALALFCCNAVEASCPTFPYAFTNGTTADATQVNADFANVTTCFAPISNPLFTGNVGVGTSSPTAPLSVSGGSGTLANFDGSAANAASWLTLSRQGIITGYVGTENSTGNGLASGDVPNAFVIRGNTAINISIGGNATAGMTIANSGNVGIGTTTPAYMLQVFGSVAASAYVTTSDARLKKDIVPLTNGLSVIEQLQGVRYQWRTSAERSVGKDLKLDVGEPQVGFIAQDVQKALPEAVSVSTGSEKIMSVAESKIVPVLVEALKELKAQNDHLAAIVADQQTRIGVLERVNVARASSNDRPPKFVRLGAVDVSTSYRKAKSGVR